ncbi:DUF2726 domain-containing protein [Salmonella enterica]|nr:DUF2726 domain-containing protein [Salmonella enterica]
MNVKERNLFSETERELFVSVSRLMPDNVKVLSRVKLSEFLIPAAEYGTDLFYHDFMELNKIVSPFLLFNTDKGEVFCVFSLIKENESPAISKAKCWLENCGIAYIEGVSIKEILSKINDVLTDNI